jgi:hypothetical protein
LVQLILLVSPLSLQSRTFVANSDSHVISKEIRELAFRVDNLVFIKQDLSTIDKYTNEFLDSAKLPTEKMLGYQTSLSVKILQNLQIPQKQLLSLQKYAVALKSYELKPLDRRLNQIIWWTEVRLINNKLELIEFLNKQIYSSMQKEVLNIYAEKGMIDELNYWSKNLKKNRIEDEFNIAIRKAEIIKLLKLNPNNISKVLETELKKSIYYVMWPFNRGSSLEHNYVKWLFYQMGVFRENPKVSQILAQIIIDESYLYIKKVNLLPIQMREEYIQGIHSNLNLTDKALQALSPYENIHKDRRYEY